MDAHSMLMTYRPMSQFLRLFVVPEIERRVAAGALAPDALPFQVVQFRLLPGGGQNIIEINEDVKIAAKVPVNRAMNAGEALTLADINPDECFLQPPTLNGNPASFFLCRSSFLNFITMFDFTPGIPAEGGDPDDAPRPMRYPLAEMARAEQMLEVMRRIEKYRALADASWPPRPRPLSGRAVAAAPGT